MEKRKKRLVASIIINIILVAMTLVGFRLCLQEKGYFTFFRFYTEDSNLLSMVVCGIYAIMGIAALKKKGYDLPKWIQLLKYVTTSCLMVTFTVVALVLAPMDGFDYKEYMFTGSMVFYHFLCPLITFFSFIFLDCGEKLDKNSKFFALIPTAIYAIIMITLNILIVTKGPYFFLRVYDRPWYMSCVWFVVVIGIAFLIAIGVLKLKKLHN